MDAPTTRYRRVLPWALLCIALGVLAVVVAVARYDSLPDPYPTHFGVSGEADSFSDKSWGDVLFPVVMGQMSGLLMIVIALAVTGRGARMSTSLAALGCAIGGGTSVMSTLQYLADDAEPPAWAFWAFLVATLAATAWVVVASVRVSSEGLEDDPERDHWRLGGLVYVNPDDPDVLVSKRAGLGTTLNLGRPLGWVLLALLLLPAVIVVALVATLT